MEAYYFRDNFWIPGNSVGYFKMLQKGSKLVFYTEFLFCPSWEFIFEKSKTD